MKLTYCIPCTCTRVNDGSSMNFRLVSASTIKCQCQEISTDEHNLEVAEVHTLCRPSRPQFCC